MITNARDSRHRGRFSKNGIYVVFAVLTAIVVVTVPRSPTNWGRTTSQDPIAGLRSSHDTQERINRSRVLDGRRRILVESKL